MNYEVARTMMEVGLERAVAQAKSQERLREAVFARDVQAIQVERDDPELYRVTAGIIREQHEARLERIRGDLSEVVRVYRQLAGYAYERERGAAMNPEMEQELEAQMERVQRGLQRELEQELGR